MGFSSLSEHIKETCDKLDGFITGNLIVDLKNQTVELETKLENELVYIPLFDKDHIEVRNDNTYTKIIASNALSTVDSLMGCSLYAGLYTRVKRG